MKILTVVPSYLPAERYGGPIYSVHGLCRALYAAGHEVDVVTTNRDHEGVSDVPLGQPVTVDGVRVRYFPVDVSRRLFWSRPLGRYLDRHAGDYDVAHLHAMFLMPTLQGRAASIRRRVPFVVSPRGMLVTGLFARKSRLVKTAWLRLFDRRTLESADAVHFTSELEATEADDFRLRLRRRVVIPNGVEIEAAEAAAGVERGGVEILFLGRISWKKGLDRLIPSLAHIPGAELTVAGPDEEGYWPRLRELARETGVLDRVRYVGAVSGARKWELLKAARVLVLPSYSENFGNVVLEAAAVGTPAVVTAQTGVARWVHEESCGVVSDGDPSSLAASVASILRDDGAARTMGERGKRMARNVFSWAAVALAMAELYVDLTPSRNPHTSP